MSSMCIQPSSIYQDQTGFSQLATENGIHQQERPFIPISRYLQFSSNIFSSFPTLQILLVDTKIPRSTGKMVSGLRERYNEV